MEGIFARLEVIYLDLVGLVENCGGFSAPDAVVTFFTVISSSADELRAKEKASIDDIFRREFKC